MSSGAQGERAAAWGLWERRGLEVKYRGDGVPSSGHGERPRPGGGCLGAAGGRASGGSCRHGVRARPAQIVRRASASYSLSVVVHAPKWSSGHVRPRARHDGCPYPRGSWRTCRWPATDRRKGHRDRVPAARPHAAANMYCSCRARRRPRSGDAALARARRARWPVRKGRGASARRTAQGGGSRTAGGRVLGNSWPDGSAGGPRRPVRSGLPTEPGSAAAVRGTTLCGGV